MNKNATYYSIPFFMEMLDIRCKIETDTSGYVLIILIPSSTSDARYGFIEWFVKEIVPKKYVNIQVIRNLWFNWPKKVSTKGMKKQSSCIKVKR